MKGPKFVSAVRCEYCLSPIGKGKSHLCTERDRRENINDLISGSSNITKERVLSSQLKEWTEEQGVSRGKEISLSTRGKQQPVIVGSTEKKMKPSPFFSS